MRNNSVKAIALGGVLSGVSVVIMCLGTLIPVATFTCPVLAMLTGYLVVQNCGRKVAWCWYSIVVFLTVLFAPDKEAVAVFTFLGYYPIIKEKFDQLHFCFFWKLLFFNFVIGFTYSALIYLFGFSDLSSEYAQFGFWGIIVVLILGNITFLLVDRLLTMMLKRKG